MITGCFAIAFTFFVISSAHFGSWPKVIPPAFTFGQEILISSMSTSSEASRSTTARYSSSEWPHTFTIILAFFSCRKARSRWINVSIPGFCNPIALSIPLFVSAIRGVGFPAHGTLATPFVVTAPSFSRSTNSLYSIPEPNVPEAVVTGFLNVIPAKFTSRLIFRPPFLLCA